MQSANFACHVNELLWHSISGPLISWIQDTIDQQMLHQLFTCTYIYTCIKEVLKYNFKDFLNISINDEKLVRQIIFSIFIYLS